LIWRFTSFHEHEYSLPCSNNKAQCYDEMHNSQLFDKIQWVCISFSSNYPNDSWHNTRKIRRRRVHRWYTKALIKIALTLLFSHISRCSTIPDKILKRLINRHKYYTSNSSDRVHCKLQYLRKTYNNLSIVNDKWKKTYFLYSKYISQTVSEKYTLYQEAHYDENKY